MDRGLRCSGIGAVVEERRSRAQVPELWLRCVVCGAQVPRDPLPDPGIPTRSERLAVLALQRCVPELFWDGDPGAVEFATHASLTKACGGKELRANFVFCKSPQTHLGSAMLLEVLCSCCEQARTVAASALGGVNLKSHDVLWRGHCYEAAHGIVAKRHVDAVAVRWGRADRLRPTCDDCFAVKGVVPAASKPVAECCNPGVNLDAANGNLIAWTCWPDGVGWRRWRLSILGHDSPA